MVRFANLIHQFGHGSFLYFLDADFVRIGKRNKFTVFHFYTVRFMTFTLCAFFRHSGSGDGFRAGFTVTGGILTGGVFAAG